MLNWATESNLPSYSLSVRPTRLWSARDIIRSDHGHFEGTPYDLTKFPATGLHGDPDLYDTAKLVRRGAELRFCARHLPVPHELRRDWACVCTPPREVGVPMHYAQNQPHSSKLIPLYEYSGIVPRVLARDSLFRLSWDSRFRFVALVSNWVHLYYTCYTDPALRTALRGVVRRGGEMWCNASRFTR